MREALYALPFVLIAAAVALWWFRFRTTRLQCDASSTFSPAYHNEEGWPAVAIEMLPPVGNATVKRATLTEHVIATYGGQGLEDFTIEETIPGGDDIELISLRDEVTERHPEPRGKLVLAINKTIAERAKKDLPPGYDPIPRYITVEIGADMRVRGR